MEQQIKDEIYKYVQTLDLSEEELSQIDTYVNNILLYLKPILAAQNDIVSKDDMFKSFKQLIDQDLGE